VVECPLVRPSSSVLTHYDDHLPAMVHDAIDWLRGGGITARYASNPWPSSAPQKPATAGSGRATSRKVPPHRGTRVIEPITVTTLDEAVTRLAEQANITKPTTLTVASTRTTPTKH
jgi:hypothetical protein